MGTAIGIDIRDPFIVGSAVDRVFAYLRGVDGRFSTYREDSEISRLARGEMQESDCSFDVRQVLALCDQLRVTTNGYFDARAHRPDGHLDPTGVVKGWAIDEAAWMLDSAGACNFAINAGGDIVARGRPEPGRAWRVGIRHPEQPDKVTVVLEVQDAAVATSATYERGSHIVDPHTSLPADGVLSVSVVGPTLTFADAYATAAFAMGREGPAWVAGQRGYGAYAITPDHRAVWTPLVDRLIASEPGPPRVTLNAGVRRRAPARSPSGRSASSTRTRSEASGSRRPS